MFAWKCLKSCNNEVSDFKRSVKTATAWKMLSNTARARMVVAQDRIDPMNVYQVLKGKHVGAIALDKNLVKLGSRKRPVFAISFNVKSKYRFTDLW